MTGAFVIEVASDTAGVALPARGGFRFAATAAAYSVIDGTYFRSAASAQGLVERFARGREPAYTCAVRPARPLGRGLPVDDHRHGAPAGTAA